MPLDWGTNPSQARSNIELIQDVKFVKMIGGGQAPVHEFIVGSADFVAGDFVAFDASGNLLSCTGVANKIAGVAMNSGPIAGRVAVIIGNPAAVFDMQATVTLGASTGARFAQLSTQAGGGVGTANPRFVLGTTATSRASAHAFQVLDLPVGHADSAHSNFQRVRVAVVVPDVAVGSAR